MRLFFEHTRTHSVSHSVLEMRKVKFDDIADASKRPVFFRFLQQAVGGSPNSEIHVYAFKTLDEANQTIDKETFITKPDEWASAGAIAYLEGIANSGLWQTVTLTNIAANAPDMTNLKIEVNATGQAGEWDAVYGYTDSPASVFLDELEYLMEQRTGDGQILEGYSTARIMKGPEDLIIMSTAKQIVASIAEEVDVEHSSEDFMIAIDFVVTVGDRNIKSAEECYIDVMERAGGIRSLLADEYRTMNGIVTEIVIGSVAGPAPLEGIDEPYRVARIVGYAKVPPMLSDA